NSRHCEREGARQFSRLRFGTDRVAAEARRRSEKAALAGNLVCECSLAKSRLTALRFRSKAAFGPFDALPKRRRFWHVRRPRSTNAYHRCRRAKARLCPPGQRSRHLTRMHDGVAGFFILLEGQKAAFLRSLQKIAERAKAIVAFVEPRLAAFDR